jgi:heptosyltransferase-2/heptosyltransferase-3
MRRLVINFAGIGDLVMLEPMTRHLARSGALEMLTRPWGEALFAPQPYVERVHVLRKPNVSHGIRLWVYGPERKRLGREVLSGRGFDEVVIYRRERQVVRDWIDSWRGTARLVECDHAPYPGERSQAEASAATLASGGYDLTELDPVPRLAVPEEMRARWRSRLGELGRRVVVVHPGSSDSRRRLVEQPHLKGLAPRQWGAIVTRLLRDGDADAVVLSGSPAERQETRALASLLPEDVAPRVHDLAGTVSLAELPACLSAAYAVLTIDSGPAHLAAAVGAPLLEVFGPTDPAMYRPASAAPVEVVLGSAPCQFCHGTAAWKRCRENVCLASVPHEALNERWKALARRIG